MTDQTDLARYQAVGILEGPLGVVDDWLHIQAEHGLCRLHAMPNRGTRYERLKGQAGDESKSFRVIVYPQTRYTEVLGQIYPEITFGYSGVNRSKEGYLGTLKGGEFVLRGQWKRKLPGYPDAIAIRRNYSETLEASLPELEEKRRRAMLVAQHHVVNWDNAPVPVWEFEDGARQPSPYFVQVKAKLAGTGDRFDVLELLEEPTRECPRHLKMRGRVAHA